MELNVYDLSGKKTSTTVELSNAVFNANVHNSLMHQAVKIYLANQRQGTSKAKGRSEVNGSTAKLYSQKGTGNARAGSKKSPTRVGGGVAFGPSPRDYRMKINKKQSKIARLSAFTVKAQEKNIFIIDDIKLDSPKTSDVAKMLVNMKLAGKKILVLLENNFYIATDNEVRYNENLIKSLRNIKKLTCCPADTVNTYDILNHEILVISKNSLKTIDRVNG